MYRPQYAVIYSPHCLYSVLLAVYGECLYGIGGHCSYDISLYIGQYTVE